MQLSRKITAFLAGAAALAPLSALADDEPPTPPPIDETPQPDPDELPPPMTDPPPPPAPQPPPPPVTTTIDDGTIYSDTPTNSFGYAWRDSRLQSEIGVAVALGGGVGGFTGDSARGVVTSDVGGLWGVKATIGSHIPLGIDVGYVGSASDVGSLTGAGSGTLVGTTVEAALRWNILPQYQLNPYIFAGLGYQRYDVTNADFSLSANGIEDEDTSLIVPMGAGLAWRDSSGLLLDVHGTFRANTNSELLLSRTNPGEFASMNTWEASANIGFEF